jgi:hypothetical protein
LSDYEESELENFIVKMATLGFAYGRKEIIDLVQQIMDRKQHGKVQMSHGWWDSIRKRHTNIVLRHAVPLSQVHHMSGQSEVSTLYFEELECSLFDNDVIDSPCQIYNMDESGFPLDPKSAFIACKRRKTPYLCDLR